MALLQMKQEEQCSLSKPSNRKGSPTLIRKHWVVGIVYICITYISNYITSNSWYARGYTFHDTFRFKGIM